MILKDLGEFDLIKRIDKSNNPLKHIIKGIGDDCSVLRYSKDKYYLYTTDMLIEGVHFLKKDSPYLVGRKSLAVSISDIASMGGVPKAFLVSLGIPKSLDVKYIDALYKGMRVLSKKFNIDLAGGDIVSSKKIIINISLIGEVNKKEIVYRSGAKIGDSIFITGRIGNSLISKRHLLFIPRIKEATFLVKNFSVTSMIDVSDGLLGDLGHILNKSKCGALIEKAIIPLNKDVKSFEKGVRDGEDFELIFTINRSDERDLLKKWPFDTKLTKIGSIIKEKSLFILDNDKKILSSSKGYTHF